MNMRAFLFLVVTSLGFADAARAMCGCMLLPAPKQGVVANAKIVNKASKVILARDGDKTTMTLANDFVGAPAEFGLVVPVPTIVQRSDVKIVDAKLFDELEKVTAPRLVETEDVDPCSNQWNGNAALGGARMAPSAEGAAKGSSPKASDYGVKVESHFFAGEYEIAVLSGTDSAQLVAWLQKLDYQVPDDAAAVLGSYIKQKMFFFVARVHVKEMGNSPRFLRPIQVSYTTPKLMLPIRLGMVNANGPQELLLFVLSKLGRVEPTNYRSMKLPTGQGELPAFVKDSFDDVYAAAFAEATKRESMRVIFTEAAMVLSARSDVADAYSPSADMKKSVPSYFQASGGVPHGVLTRLHFRYDASTFPEDLALQETSDQASFLSRFKSRKHQLGPTRCPAHAQYLSALPPVLDREAQVLANLTGWSIEDVRKKLPKP